MFGQIARTDHATQNGHWEKGGLGVGIAANYRSAPPASCDCAIAPGWGWRWR